MRWSFTIAKVGSIEIKVHVTFVLLLAWIGVVYYRQGGRDAALAALLFIILLFTSVVLHELGHALAARRYGIKTPDITLLPIGGVARLERMPEDPKQELVVALAGPATSLLIALVLFVIVGPTASVEDLAGTGSRALLVQLLVANVILALFNLLPAFPMDGGRVLRALLAMRMSYVRATGIAARLGQGLAFLLGFLGLFYNPWLIFIALFVYLGATQEAAASQMKAVSDTLPLSAALVTEFHTLAAHDTLGTAADALLSTHQHDFPVVDARGALQGILTRDDLIAGLKRDGAGAAIGAVMRTDVPSVPRNTSFSEAFRMMQECRCPALAVIDATGRPVGLLTPENVGEMMMIHAALRPEETPAWRGSGTWRGPTPARSAS